MSEIKLIALRMMADPATCHADTWDEANQTHNLNPNEDVDFECFVSVCHAAWVYARLSQLILEGDDQRLSAFIERVDSRRLVRDKFSTAPEPAP